jgi:hypothetical protein
MQIRDILAVLVVAVVLGLVFFATLKLERPTPNAKLEQTK